MYKLLCIVYNDHHLVFCIVCSVMLCFESPDSVPQRHRENRWQIVFTLLFSVEEDLYTTVVKTSKRKLLYMLSMNGKCGWHLFCEVRHRGSRVIPLFWYCNILIEKVCISNFFNSFQVIFILFMVFLISFDKVEIGGILITISDSCIFNR